MTAGAFAFGVTIAIGRSLARAGIAASTVLGIRFGIGGNRTARRPDRFPPAPPPVAGERAAVAISGVCCAVESTLFYLGLAYGSAAPVSPLFYASPAVVVVLELVVRRVSPGRKTYGCLALSGAGTGLIASAATVHFSMVAALTRRGSRAGAHPTIGSAS